MNCFVICFSLGKIKILMFNISGLLCLLENQHVWVFICFLKYYIWENMAMDNFFDFPTRHVWLPGILLAASKQTIIKIWEIWVCTSVVCVCVCIYIHIHIHIQIWYTDRIYIYNIFHTHMSYTYFIHIYICCDMYHLPFASWFTQIYGVCFVAFMCWKRNINPFQHLDLWKGLVVTPKAIPWKFLFTLLKTIEPWNFEGWLENREYSSSLVIMKSHEITI